LPTQTVQNLTAQPEPSKIKPGDTPTPDQATPMQPNAFYNGVSFVYDPSLAKGVKASTVEATGPESDQLPLFAVNPNEDQFEFQGYVINGGIKPLLAVFSIKEYEKLGGDTITQQVETLKKILSARPGDYSGNMPNLPVGNAGQIIHSQVQYLKLQNGSGLRYLTQFAQDVSPISNDRLVYVFQGITADGAYYISAIFPITNSSLPANYDKAMKGLDPQKFSENFSNYLLDVQKQLNEQKSDSFTPTLDRLDTMMSTVKVEK
jgi:hypothetical protein